MRACFMNRTFWKLAEINRSQTWNTRAKFFVLTTLKMLVSAWMTEVAIWATAFLNRISEKIASPLSFRLGKGVFVMPTRVSFFTLSATSAGPLTLRGFQGELGEFCENTKHRPNPRVLYLHSWSCGCLAAETSIFSSDKSHCDSSQLLIISAFKYQFDLRYCQSTEAVLLMFYQKHN